MADLTPWKFCHSCHEPTLADGKPCQHCGTPSIASTVKSKKVKKKKVKVSEGKWTYSEDCECWVCSVCGAAALNDFAGRSTPSTFCPHCGKPMILVIKEAEENG